MALRETYQIGSTCTIEVDPFTHDVAFHDRGNAALVTTEADLRSLVHQLIIILAEQRGEPK